MNRRSIAVTCRQRIVELTHPQGTPLDIVLALGPGMSITESTVFRADLQTARYPASAPLARTTDVTAAPGATGPWTLALSGAQLNQTVVGESSRFWLPVYGVVSGSRVEPVCGIVITLTANNISSLAPPPPVEPIYLTEASASDLYAALADFDALEGRVTSLESQEGGGAQADWSATSGPSQILNKPTLGNSSSRNVGTGAGDVATGNHTHSSTSQIAGLDTALAAKADLSGGKLLVSQLPDLAIKEYLGAPANQAAMLALTGQRGDWCSRIDDGKIWVITAEPSSSLANWFALTYPNAPVLSVAGRTGSITLGIGDISSLQGALDAKADSASLLSLAFRDTVGSAQIDAAAVINSKLAAMAAATLKGSVAGGTPADLSATEATSLLNVFSATLKGLAPPSGGGTTAYLRADGTWATPPGGSPAGTGSELQFRNAGAFGAVPNSSVSGGAVTFGGAEGYAANPSPLLTLRNTTPATSSVQQVSPSLSLAGQGWNSTAVASQAVEFEAFVRPSSAAGPPTSVLVVRSRSNAGSWTEQMTLGNSGATLPWTTATAFDCTGARLWNSACRLASNSVIFWTDGGSVDLTADLFLRRRATANLQIGPADGASPVAQTISVQNATGTHVSAAAAVFSLDGAQGRGTGAGGDVRIRVAPNGSTSGVLNPLVEAIRFRATDLSTVCAGALIAGGPVVYASFTSSTLPSVTLWTRGQIWIAGDAGGPGVPAFSDGTNWRRYSDNSIVVPS